MTHIRICLDNKMLRHGRIFKCIACHEKRAIDTFICDPCRSTLLKKPDYSHRLTRINE